MEGVVYHLSVIEMAPIAYRHSDLAAMSPKTRPHTCTWQLKGDSGETQEFILT